MINKISDPALQLIMEQFSKISAELKNDVSTIQNRMSKTQK